jgi:hypothetical protein
MALILIDNPKLSLPIYAKVDSFATNWGKDPNSRFEAKVFARKNGFREPNSHGSMTYINGPAVIYLLLSGLCQFWIFELGGQNLIRFFGILHFPVNTFSGSGGPMCKGQKK